MMNGLKFNTLFTLKSDQNTGQFAHIERIKQIIMLCKIMLEIFFIKRTKTADIVENIFFCALQSYTSLEKHEGE